MLKRLTLTSAIAIIAAAHPAIADQETDALRAQIKALEARLDALEKKQAAAKNVPPIAQSSVSGSRPAAAMSPVSPSVPVTASSDGSFNLKEASVEYNPGNGLYVTSPDKNFKFHFGGYVQADDHTFIGNAPSGNTNQFFIRSARPTFEAQFYHDFFARLMLDYGNNQTTLLDAYGDYRPSLAFNIRVGKFKDPIGLERWQGEQDTLFVERGMTTNLVPYRDNGVQLYGQPIAHTLEYQLALTNGAPDQVNATNNTDNDQNVTARVFIHPFYNAGVDALKGLGVGVAGSYGERDASLTSPNLTTGYVTPTQSKFFTYSASAYASGEQWRLNPQLMYYNGPFSLLGEYVLEEQGLKSGAVQKDIRNNAWEAITTYVLTGEDARFDGVVPKHDFDPAHDQWGAFELAARVSQLHVDDAVFPVFASLSTSAKEATEGTFGGTWYMNRNVKLNLDFTITSFDGGAVGNTDRATEKAVVSRAQFKF